MRKKRFARIFVCVVIVMAWVFLSGCRKSEKMTAEDTIEFSEYDFTAAAAIRLKSMHTGKSVWLDETEDVENICRFLSGVKGKERQSAKGYYEGTYSVQIYEKDGKTEVLSIGFGDSPAFFYGENEEDPGYPNRYTLDGIDIEDVTGFFSGYLPLTETESK